MFYVLLADLGKMDLLNADPEIGTKRLSNPKNGATLPVCYKNRSRLRTSGKRELQAALHVPSFVARTS